MMIHDFEKASIVFIGLLRRNLGVKITSHVKLFSSELIVCSHYHNWFFRSERFFCQVATFIVKKTMTISTPSNSLHQYTVINSVKTWIKGKSYTCELKLQIASLNPVGRPSGKVALNGIRLMLGRIPTCTFSS